MTGPVHQRALQAGSMLHWYHIQRTLGQGSFGITYLARDVNLDQLVAVKEYLPVDFAARGSNSSVYATSHDHEHQFHWGLERFIIEAQTIARFDHPNIVRVHVVFKENNTAYMVMRYEQGATLHSVLRTRSTLEEAEVLRILVPVLHGLERIHESGFIHRDIKPGNVLIRRDKTPVLIDFGSAREALGQKSDTLTTLVSPGYAPFEQYSAKSEEQGPWSDIYSLAATVYRCVTGAAPVEAIERSSCVLQNQPDPLVPAAQAASGRYSERFLAAIDRGLALRVGDRPPSVEAWREEFGLADGLPDTDRNLTLAVPTATITPSTLAISEPVDTASTGPRTRKLYSLDWQPNVVGAIVVLLVVVFGLAWRYQSGVSESPAPTAVAADVAGGAPAPKSERAAGEKMLAAREGAGPGSSAGGDAALARGENETAHTEGGDAEAPAKAASGPQTQDDVQQAAREPPRTRVEQLLALASRALDEYRLTTPADDNALRYYRQVLAIEPKNRKASHGLNEITKRYAWLAQRELSESDYVEARRFVRRGLRVQPDDPALLALRKEIQVQSTSALSATRESTDASRPLRDRKVSDSSQNAEDAGVGDAVKSIGNALKSFFQTPEDGEYRQPDKSPFER
ncbi:MAG: protein kinase [Gammaproteobacteria bacterium]|nr:protein kinase [Gammaproteobacteria bacterium]NIR83720.1 protein kinase [Gammaproteobacteria bacterium]NIR91867.1 protein kinase [Gammaproteobacteria bacterium]NIU04886.1 protein kinase [Gammaproteobacteria bacterium]NIV51868.1 protein kinase [Gammaproteobacteria bacterium]